MASKDLRTFLEEPVDKTWINEMSMTLKQIADKEGISRTMVTKILKNSLGKLYKAIANDEENRSKDAFEKVVILVKMIEELGGTEVSPEKILEYLPKDIVKDVKEAAKNHMKG